jgi:hypothetical protein
MIVVKPTAMTADEKHTAIAEVIARLEATHPHQFVNCPSCEGVGYHLPVWARTDADPRELDRVQCPCCDGSGLVLPEERDNWSRFTEQEEAF